MNSKRLEQYKEDLQAQRDGVLKQLAMLEGAIQLTVQLIDEAQKEEADNSASSESAKDGEEL